MPDTIAATEAVAEAPAPVTESPAPVVEEAPAVAPASVEDPAAPLSKDDARKGLRADRASKREATPKIDRHGQKHDATSGEYIEPDAGGDGVPSEAAAKAAADKTLEAAAAAEGEEAPAADVAADEEAVADATAEGDAPAADVAAEASASDKPPADQLTDAEADTRPGIQVEIAGDHPVRGMGLEKFTVSSDLEAQGLQALLNGVYVRKKALAALEQDNLELQQKVARSEANQTATTKWQGTPEYQKAVEEYEAIKESMGPESASRYWQGVVAGFDELANTEYRNRMETVETARLERQAQEWREQAWDNTMRMPVEVRNLPQFGRLFQETVDTLNAQLAMGHHPHVDSEAQLHKMFTERFTARILEQKEVQDMMAARQAESRRKTAEAETAKSVTDLATQDAAQAAVNDFKVSTAEGRLENPTNPLAAMSHAGGADESTAADPDKGPDLDKMTSHELKQHLRKGARDDARRRFAT